MLVIAHLNQNQPCHALAHSIHSKIVSRKSNGRYTSFSLENYFDEKIGGGPADRDLKSGEKQSFFRISDALHHVQTALRSTFLPALPSNQDGTNNGNQIATLRRSGYLSYILYDNIQDLSTSLRSVLATQRILEGVGVGRAGATALSATLNFLIRDGCGMIASLLFTSYAAHSFRRNVKRWKYFADIMVDIGITLEILAPSVLSYPMLSGWFLPLLCLGNVCKALCGVAAGACGGALQMHWAVKIIGTEEGISEVAAKGGAQRTVMGAGGLILSALTAKWLGSGDVRTAIGLYCALTAIHLISNYRSLKLVALNWLNGWRLHLVVEQFLDCVTNGKDNIDGEVAAVVSNPMDASRKEPLIFLKRQSLKYPIRLGVSFNKFAQLTHRPSLLIQSHLAKRQSELKDNYILAVGHAGDDNSQEPQKGSQIKQSILVAFFSNSSNTEKAKAYLHASLVGRALASLLTGCKEGQSTYSEMEMIQRVEETAESELDQLWPIFEQCVSDAGWILDKTECATEGYEMYFE
ncbi:hypothetical protein ACHAXR_012959 [Thalassiosira sp. AJA248-18]